MPSYSPPIRDMAFALTRLAGLEAISALPGQDGLSIDLAIAVLAEAGKLAAKVLAPLNATGDQQGCRIDSDGSVRTPQGFRAAYAQFVEGGWPALPFDPRFGGQGLPWLLTVAISESWSSANLAFALCPMLTQAATAVVQRYGDPELRAHTLRHLISGHWTAAIGLSEEQAGSDLSAIRCRAVRELDHWRITGQKVHIGWGDHDLSDNIVHLVLARTPDTPLGNKGLSLFLVPKWMTDGHRNEVRCLSLSGTLGLRGCPTAVMRFGGEHGAAGWMLGAEGDGLAVAFAMLDISRMMAGMQGMAVAERAYQKARDHAFERRQGRPPGKPEAPPMALIRHPDVRRTLLSMKAETEAARALIYCTAEALDLAERHPDPTIKSAAQARAGLLIPLAKAWGSEVGVRVADQAVQVFGGAGYVEETGAAQHLRDARAANIREGTNGIQALDLLRRKLLGDQGQAAQALLTEMTHCQGPLADPLAVAVAHGQAALDWLLAHAQDDALLRTAATPLMRLFALLTCGWLMARAAQAATEELAASAVDRSFLEGKVITARFFAASILPQTAVLLADLQGSGPLIEALRDDQF